MDAVISGRVGRALLIDGDSLRSFDVDEPSKLVPSHRADLPYIFGEGGDLRVLENSSLESIQQELINDSTLSLALDLTLISLDGELPDNIRKEATEDANELLADSQVVERLESILYSRPLPEDADLAGALDLCRGGYPECTFALLKGLEERQSLISAVAQAWDAIPTRVFGGHEQRAYFQHVTSMEGAFRNLVVMRETRIPISTFLVKASLSPSILQLPNYRQVLHEWVRPFLDAAETPRIKLELEEEEVDTSPRRRHGRRVGLNRRSVLKEVNKKKATITDAIYRRDLTRVRELVDDLVHYQRRGETEHVAKSLCDLAMEAKNLGMFPLQLEMTQRSINIASDDGWSWAQHADALLNLNQLDEALKAYDQAASFGAGVIAKTGRAEVLKAQGDLPAALAAFNQVISEHPENVVAKNGRAEVLKAQGDLPAALAAFNQVISNYPQEVFAKTGRAEVLKAQGDLPAALAAFNQVISEHPENVVAKTGRAEVLKAQGDLPAALAAFNQVISEHPENVVAKTGRAEVLKAQGDLPAALAAFNQVISEHPENVVAKTGRAEVLKAQGDLPAALAAFNQVISEHPEDVVAKTGRAEVLKAQGDLPAALAAFNQVISNYPQEVFAKTGRAEVLKAQGDLPAALAAFNQVISEHPENLVAKTGRAEVLKAQGDLPAALAAFNQVISEHPENLVAKNGRAEVLKAQGDLPAALAAFNQVISEHPENLVAKNGRAEVLKAQGDLPAALAAFNQVISNYPQEVFAKTGRAEVLRAQGDLPAALAAFNQVISEHPENLVAKTGRAEVLKAQRRLGDAIAAYDEIFSKHPDNKIVRSGRSCVLAALERYDEALEHLPNRNPVTLDDWIGYHIRGMILLRTGKISEALRIFNEGVQNDPRASSREYFKTSLAVAWLRGRRFDKASEALENVKSPLLQQPANILRLHAFGAQGDLRRARIAYEGLSSPHLLFSEVTQELRNQYLLGNEPRHDESWVSDEEIKLFLLAA